MLFFWRFSDVSIPNLKTNLIWNSCESLGEIHLIIFSVL